MKPLTCEMCGSNDLIKDGGVFICQSCGCKYSVEEARKMMIEGTVDVSGSIVHIDNSAYVEKYLANARRAKEKTDWEEVEKYYNMVEQNDPKNIEAIFYSSYGKAMLSLVEVDRYKRQQKFDVFCKSISVIDDYYDSKISSNLMPIIKDMSSDLVRLTKSNYVYNSTQDSNATKKMLVDAEMQFIESIENIIKKDDKAYLYKILLTHYERCILNDTIDKNVRESMITKLNRASEELAKRDTSFRQNSHAEAEYHRQETEKEAADARSKLLGWLWFAFVVFCCIMGNS